MLDLLHPLHAIMFFMNRVPIFLEESQTNDEYLIVDPYRIEHIKNVIRGQAGDPIKITLINHGIGVAKILSLSPQEIKIQLLSLTSGKPERLCMLIGVCRPPSMEKILEHATTSGVGEIHFFCAELSDKSYLKSRVLREELIQKKLLDGLAQSATGTHLPKVMLHKNLGQALGVLPNSPSRFMLSPQATAWFNDYPPCEEPVFAIGPERGFTEKEEALLFQNKFLPVCISRGILRVEMAVFHAQAQLELCQRLLSQKISETPLR